MPRSNHPSAGTIHANGGNRSRHGRPADLSACLLSWWQAHGRRDPLQKLDVQRGRVWLTRINSSIPWHLDRRGDAAADPVGRCALPDALDGGVSHCGGPGRGVSGRSV